MPKKATQKKNSPSVKAGVPIELPLADEPPDKSITIELPLADEPPDNSVYIPRHVEVGHLSGEHGRMLYRLREGFRAAGTVLASGKPVYQNADAIRKVLDLLVSAAAQSNRSNHAQKETRQIAEVCSPSLDEKSTPAEAG